MREQLLLIGTKGRPGCNFSRTPAADTWKVNLRITESKRFPFVYCDECPRQSCFRFKNGRPGTLASERDADVGNDISCDEKNGTIHLRDNCNCGQ